MFFEYRKDYLYGKYTCVLTEVKEDLVKDFNLAIYDRLGLILDIEKTRQSHDAWQHYDLIFVIDKDCLEVESVYPSVIVDTGVTLEHMVDSVCRHYYSKIDNQGNVEFTPACCLEDKIKMELREEVRDSFYNYNLDLFNRIASANRHY